MDIPVINRIMEFETNIKALQNPSFASQVLSVSNTVMKWSALILALVASFTTIICRVKILIIRLQRHPSLASHQQSLVNDDGDYDTETESSSSFSDDDDEEEEGDEEDESVMKSFGADEDFSVRGYGQPYIEDQWQNTTTMGLRRRRRRSIGDLFSWSELTGGKSVVKLWDNLGLNDVVRGSDSGNLFATYDINCEPEIQKIGSVFGAKLGIPTLVAKSLSPAVMVSAAGGGGGLVELMGWDARIGSRLPAILAEWRPKIGHVRDDVSSAMTVGDVRKVNVPLEDLTEKEADTWWNLTPLW